MRLSQLQTKLGARALDVACRFLIEGPNGRWRFRPEFATERGILEAECLQPRSGSPQWLLDELAATQSVLLGLLRNVLLIADEESPHAAFHLRFNLMQAPAFAELEDWQQEAFRNLYQARVPLLPVVRHTSRAHPT